VTASEPADVTFEQHAEALLALYNAMPDMMKEALARRTQRPTNPARLTLEKIGQHYGVTRERVRQVGAKGVDQIQGLMDVMIPGWRDGHYATPEQIVDGWLFCDALSPDSSGAVVGTLLLEAGGLQPIADAPRFWTADPMDAIRRARSLIPTEPVPVTHWDEYVAESGMPQPVLEALGINAALIQVGDHYVRATHERADRVTLILRELGGEATSEQILARLPEDTTVHVLSSYLSRYPQFERNRLRRTWTFAGVGENSPYANAMEAVVDVLNAEGPLHRRHLEERVFAVHPVTTWRIAQCLNDSRIGTMPDGRLWLVEHGATRETVTEPRQPASMSVSNDTLGVRLLVDRELMRGSGLNLHRWLAWRLGMATVPSEMVFTPHEVDEKDILIRAVPGGTTVSSLRGPAQALSLIEGCTAILVLRIETRTWRLVHGCQPETCPRSEGLHSPRNRRP
jgi:hypothetical protein